MVYVDGSFVTSREHPDDFDVCWDTTGVDGDQLKQLAPLLLKVDKGGWDAQKLKYRGKFFPTQVIEGGSGKVFLEFFQIDKTTGNHKGIVALKLREIWS
ncbi:hypothetical protein LKE08_18985 [Lyngbya sp. CCY1209]|nr:hypothetical protein [Lyngbya sp. CCY1209]MEB3885515.1 hypothetical protein [Lyngbya sp. CCY1209]